jgi:phosphatidylglycerol:prolipoprotein diacylglycerol transferase
MFPEAFKIFGLQIYWYGVLITVGILAAIAYSWFRAKHYGLTKDQLTDLAFVVIIVGILGARILYILTHLEQYIANPGQIFQIQMQGMAFLGIIIFNIPAVLIFAKVKKLNFWRIIDLAAPAIAIGYFFGRLGCFMGGCCYGPDCSWGLVMKGSGIAAPVFPTQILNAIIAILIFLALWFISRKFKLKAGELFVWFVYLYAFTHIGTEFLRADEGHSALFGTPFNASQLGLMAMALTAFLFQVLYLRKQETLSMVDEETVRMIEEKDRKIQPSKPPMQEGHVEPEKAEEKEEGAA